MNIDFYIERDGEEIGLQIEGDYVRGQRQTWDEPGYPEDAEITGVFMFGHSVEIELTPKETEQAKEALIEAHHDEVGEAKIARYEARLESLKL